MKTGKQIIDKNNSPSESCTKSGDFILLSAYIDGELPESQAMEFSEHLKNCEYCKALYDSAIISLKLTSRYKEANAGALAAMPSEQLEQSKSLLLKALRLEPGYGMVTESSITDMKREKPKGGFFARLGSMKLSSYTSVAAILVVVIITLIAYSNTGILKNFTGKILDNKQATMDSYTDNIYEITSYDEGTRDSETMGRSDSDTKDGMASPDAVSANQEYSPSSSVSSYSASASASKSFDMAAADRIYFTGQDYSWLDPENDMKYTATTAESFFSSEYSDTNYMYVGIFAYPKDTIDTYFETFNLILGTSAVHASIEITGGDNSQKLVEYTGEDEALYMLSKAEMNNAALLIISIGR
ncbi:MAG: zf-HC2 domain-containing protein [Saccharofermentanales bacterium]